MLPTPYTLTEAEALALLAEPSPYTVDLYGIRERRPGEAPFHRVSFEEFEARVKKTPVERARELVL